MKESSAGERKLGTPSCSFQQDESASSQLSFSKPLLTTSLRETADPVMRDLHSSGLGVEGHFAETGGETSTPQGGGETSVPHFRSLQQWNRGIKLHGKQMWFLLWKVWSQASCRNSLAMQCKLLKMLSRDIILLESKYTLVNGTVFSPCL